jgi:hypothetical protein
MTRRALAVILFGVVLAACSPGAASVAPSATAAPTAAPTVAATAAPTPVASAAAGASASAAPDPSVGLKIDAPYALAALDPALEALFRDQFTKGAGAFGSLIGVGGKTITQDGKLVGYVFVIGFPAGMLSDVAYKAMVTGMQSSMQVTFTTQTISGVDVSVGSSATANMAVFQDGDHVILALTPTPAELPKVAKALIDANK